MIKDILEVLIKNMVEDKEGVTITEKNDEKGSVFEVKVARADMGKVIGKQGRVAKSIRTIMRAISSREQKRITIEFVD